jgi:hypothetical protein
VAASAWPAVDAVDAGAGADAVVYELVTYEGFAPHQVPVIVECLTDNKNRAAADIRVIFRKGQLGNVGTVGWMFDRLGVIDATHEGKGLDIEGAAIEAGAQNVEPLDPEEVPAGHTGATFYCDTSDLDAVNKALVQQQWVVTKAEMNYIAKNFVDLSDDQRKEVAAQVVGGVLQQRADLIRAVQAALARRSRGREQQLQVPVACGEHATQLIDARTRHQLPAQHFQRGFVGQEHPLGAHHRPAVARRVVPQLHARGKSRDAFAVHGRKAPGGGRAGAT